MVRVTAFREAHLSSAPALVDDYETLEARLQRYSIYWAFFENTPYSPVHSWSVAFKHQLALGKYIRPIYNPAPRLGEFYAAHLWGGDLDPEAGPGGCIPILVDSGDDAGNVEKEKRLRAAIATLWRGSNFAALKDEISLRGAVEGDAVLRVVDDPEKAKVYLERIDVSTVAGITRDAFGNVKAYVIEEEREDSDRPRAKPAPYRLEVTRDGENVVYKTFKNGKPYGWDGQPAQWEIAYTFVPLVHIQHRDVGNAWGQSEFQPLLAKVVEADDLASMLSDHIRRYVHPHMLMVGMAGPDDLTSTSGASAVTTGAAGTRPQPGREEGKLHWTKNKDADVKPMLADLDLADSLAHLKGLAEGIARDCPELRVDAHATAGTSGRALRIARQQVSAKVRQRRMGYDAGLVRLHQMAISIGGMRGYAGYEGFNLESYDAGDLDHSIAPRAVFEADPMDDREVSAALWEAAKTAVAAGASLEGFLKREGWSEGDIAEIVGEQEEG